MSKDIETYYSVDLEYPYSHSVTLRKSALSKSAWEYLVGKFGITQASPERIQSITINGDDDYGRLSLTIVVARK